MAKKKLSPEEVKHIAKLACLKLTKEEIKKFQQQLSQVLDYMEKLKEVETKKIPPTSQVTGLKNIFKKDKVKKNKCLTEKQALSAAKEKHQGYFKVESLFE